MRRRWAGGWGSHCLAFAVGAGLLGTAGCRGPAQSAEQPELFRDVSSAAGLRFVHRNGQKESATILETTGSGCAFWDFDEDGWLDIYMINGRHGSGEGNVLYRNDGTGRFVDVTSKAGVQGQGFGMGCAVGDFDGDGRTDLYVCNFGRNELFRNRGDGTFEEVAAAAGVAAGGWSTSAAFFDADGDDDLDLYVGRYAKFGPTYPQLCGSAGVMGSCTPRTYPPEADLFYENLGNGRFREASRAMGFADPNGRCLGTLVCDYDRDGRPDLYVANDTTRNFLFHNLGGGKFKEVGESLAVAFGPDGRGEASMGLDAGDIDGDGRWDFVLGSFQGEMDSLYRQTEYGTFDHVSLRSGIGAPTLRSLTFGVGFFDYDNDGWLDIAQVNGHVNDQLEKVDPDSPFLQPRQLFRNQGNGMFQETTARAGVAFTRPAVGRGLAFGDYDNDGRVDLLVNENNRPAALLRNETPQPGNWLSIRLRGPRSNRLGLGASVLLESGGQKQLREVRSTASYIGVNDARCHFGLGQQNGVERVTVHWPDGKKTQATPIGVNQVIDLAHPSAR